VSQTIDPDPDDLTDDVEDDELADAADIDADALAGLVTLQRRRINNSGTSARLTIPKATELGLVGKVGITATVAVRRVDDDEIVLTAKIRTK